MDQKVLSLYALRSARGDVMKNAFFQKLLSDLYMGIIDEWYTIFQKIKILHGLILPVGLMSQTFELSFPAFTLARC